MPRAPPPEGYPPLPRPDEPIGRECVEGYLFTNPPPRLLIFRRIPARGHIWVPVQGKVDPADPGLEEALLREVREETGLTQPVAYFSLDWHVPFRIEDGTVWRLHAYGVEVAPDFEPTLNDEFDAFAWVDLAEAQRRLHFEDNREAVLRLARRLAGDAPKV